MMPSKAELNSLLSEKNVLFQKSLEARRLAQDFITEIRNKGMDIPPKLALGVIKLDADIATLRENRERLYVLLGPIREKKN